jgi:uncharacterized protein (DUF433 family)
MEVDYKAIQEDPALRRGLYGLGELTRYLSLDQERPLTASNVARWAQHGLSSLEHRPRRRDYSFADLVSLLVVRNLMALGLGVADIRKSEAHLRERYGRAHPFVSVRLKTDGVDVFYDAFPAISKQLTSANRGGQEVLEPAIIGALRGVSYEDGIAAAWSPTSGIVLDPTLQFGEPCIAEASITTAHLAELSSQSSPAELAHVYRIDEAAVRRALEFERRLQRAAA